MKNKDQQKLSVFVDESGSFLYPDNDSCFYVIGMVFHDQSVDIRQQLTDMDRSIRPDTDFSNLRISYAH